MKEIEKRQMRVSIVYSLLNSIGNKAWYIYVIKFLFFSVSYISVGAGPPMNYSAARDLGEINCTVTASSRNIHFPSKGFAEECSSGPRSTLNEQLNALNSWCVNQLFHFWILNVEQTNNVRSTANYIRNLFIFVYKYIDNISFYRESRL